MDRDSKTINLNAEKCTLQALLAWGDSVSIQQPIKHEDLVLQYIESKVTGLRGVLSHKDDAAEDAFVWNLYRKFKTESREKEDGRYYVTLRELLGEFTFNNCPIPEPFDKWLVSFSDGIIFRPRTGSTSILADICGDTGCISDVKRVFVKKTQENPGLSDHLFPIFSPDFTEWRNTLWQDKNKKSGNLVEALQSLDISTWYCNGNAEQRTSHLKFLQTVPSLCNPLRFALVAKQPTNTLQCLLWLLNTAWLKDFPLIVVGLSRNNLGINVLTDIVESELDVPTYDKRPQFWPSIPSGLCHFGVHHPFIKIPEIPKPVPTPTKFMYGEDLETQLRLKIEKMKGVHGFFWKKPVGMSSSERLMLCFVCECDDLPVAVSVFSTVFGSCGSVSFISRPKYCKICKEAPLSVTEGASPKRAGALAEGTVHSTSRRGRSRNTSFRKSGTIRLDHSPIKLH